MRLFNSPVDSFEFADTIFYVKRDDLLHPEFSGNKARKLAYFLENPPQEINTLVSYGGTQSNLMYSLSALAKLNRWQFHYYTKTLSRQAANSHNGNLAASLNNGMELVELNSDYERITSMLHSTSQQLVIPQGGAQIEAEYGLRQLAQEIISWARQNNFAHPAIFIASGTGASALFLQKHLPFSVYTTNCVGSPDYLTQQFHNLMDQFTQPWRLPQILTNTHYRFAKPNRQLYATIQQINQASRICFDLVYDPVGWQILLDNLEHLPKPILYLHCGGLLGNETMSKRYQYYFNRSHSC